MTRFGDFQPLCTTTPSYPWCNVFYRQLQKASNSTTSFFSGTSANPKSAPVGVNPTCGILRVGSDGSLGNIANIITCALSMVFVAGLIVFASRRKAAVGRVELRLFLVLYFLSLPFQLLTTGSVLEQGSLPLTVITAIHGGIVAALFWGLLANALVATQMVEDGTLSSLIPYYVGIVVFFVATTYISLDIGIGITSAFKQKPGDELSLHSIPLFVLTSLWPAVAALLYFIMMMYIVLVILNEIRPMWFYVLSVILFVLSQLAYFLLSKVICKAANAKVDGSFIATLLETAAVGTLYLAWRSITEDSWEDEYYPSQ